MAVNNEINGINNNLIDKLINDVGSYADDLLFILNSIDDNFNGAMNYINCDISVSLKESYEGISSNFKPVNSNILTYGTDYAKIKQAYVSRGLSIVNQVEAIETKKGNFYEEGE